MNGLQFLAILVVLLSGVTYWSGIEFRASHNRAIRALASADRCQRLFEELSSTTQLENPDLVVFGSEEMPLQSIVKQAQDYGITLLKEPPRVDTIPKENSGITKRVVSFRIPSDVSLAQLLRFLLGGSKSDSEHAKRLFVESLELTPNDTVDQDRNSESWRCIDLTLFYFQVVDTSRP